MFETAHLSLSIVILKYLNRTFKVGRKFQNERQIRKTAVILYNLLDKQLSDLLLVLFGCYFLYTINYQRSSALRRY